MSQRRTELDRIFRDILGTENVYFQPPTGIKFHYPCIVYNLADQNDLHANNRVYRRLYRYTVTYITKNPDDTMRDELDDLPYCSFDRFFASDNLNHYVYTIYY
jgi:hypothetical protein